MLYDIEFDHIDGKHLMVKCVFAQANIPPARMDSIMRSALDGITATDMFVSLQKKYSIMLVSCIREFNNINVEIVDSEDDRRIFAIDTGKDVSDKELEAISVKFKDAMDIMHE